MDKPLFDLLNTVKLIDVIVTTALFIAIIGIVIHQRKNIKTLLERWREKRNFEDTVVESINGLRDTDKKLKNDIDNMHGNLKEISQDVKNITNVLDVMRKKEELSKQAQLRDRIERIYRECSKSRKCTDMQFRTLKDLIKDYERHNGRNSFVHSIVEKEMYSWEIIERIPDEEDEN